MVKNETKHYGMLRSLRSATVQYNTYLVVLYVCLRCIFDINMKPEQKKQKTKKHDHLPGIFYLKALRIGVNPLYLMLPATISASYAFMLPAATPPNAIVYAAARMNTREMVCLCVCIYIYI